MPLLRERSTAGQIVLAFILPAAYGAFCGLLLGVNKVAYIVLALLALFGAYLAGRDHSGAREGALRGLLGGTLFGGGILLVHEATGKEAKADIPHPAILLLVITIVAAVVLGALGGRARERADEQSDDEEGPAFSFSRLEWSEYLGFVGSAVLFGSLFLPWFSTACESVDPSKPVGCNPNSRLNGQHGDFTAFQIYSILDILLVAACIAPFVLAYILARGHTLTWRPGEVTMIVGMLAMALILLNGVILGRPGDTVEIAIEPGYLIGLAGAAMILAGGVLRQAVYTAGRKPPGVF